MEVEVAAGGFHWCWKAPCARGWAGSALGVWRLGRCVEAEKRTQFFAKGRGKAQVWRQEEAGLWGGQQARPCLEEVGCSAKRSCLEILALRSCVGLLGLCLSRLFSQETRAWVASEKQKFIPHGSGGWESPSSGCWQIQRLVRAPFLCPYVGKGWVRPVGPLYKDTNSCGLHPHDLSPPDGYTFSTPWELGFNIWILRTKAFSL